MHARGAETLAANGPDLWADVGFEHLPARLVRAYEQQDWSALREELRQVMDGVITDGEHGRELLDLVLRLPVGIDPLFDRYRAMVSIDFGDWDGLQLCLDGGHPNDPAEMIGLRDIVLAPLTQTAIPSVGTERHHVLLFQAYEYHFAQLPRAYRRWAEEI